MITANGQIVIRPREVVPVFREEYDNSVTDYKYDLRNRDFVSCRGNLYCVKKRIEGYVPAGIVPDSVAGADWWEMFNKLKPTATNFLVIVDDEGTPQTLMSGGRIQAKFLNIGSLNMSETRLWGGAEPMTGKGLALINDPDDRKFVVYNDASNYVEMFQRSTEWGLIGKYKGNTVFQLGSTNMVGGWQIVNTGLQNLSYTPPTFRPVGDRHEVYGGSGAKLFPDGGIMLIPQGTGILDSASGLMQAALIKVEGSNPMLTGMEIIANRNDGGGYVSEVTGLRISAKNAYSSPKYPPVAIKITEGRFEADGDASIAGSLYVGGGLNAVPRAQSFTPASNINLILNAANVDNNDIIYYYNINSNTGLQLPAAYRTGKKIIIVNSGSSVGKIKNTFAHNPDYTINLWEVVTAFFDQGVHNNTGRGWVISSVFDNNF